MRFILKAILVLFLAGSVGLLGFAVFSELPAPQRVIAQPVSIR